MERFKIVVFMLALFLVLIPRTCQWQRPVFGSHPLCASQIALVNYACALLPYDPVLPFPPPSPPLPPDDLGIGGFNPSTDHDREHDQHHGHHHSHRHKHRHSHRHRLPSSPVEDNCCRWLQEVDSECVCQLLSHLPPFLERPRHNYSIAVGDACEVTYTCIGKIGI